MMMMILLLLLLLPRRGHEEGSEGSTALKISLGIHLQPMGQVMGLWPQSTVAATTEASCTEFRARAQGPAEDTPPAQAVLEDGLKTLCGGSQRGHCRVREIRREIAEGGGQKRPSIQTVLHPSGLKYRSGHTKDIQSSVAPFARKNGLPGHPWPSLGLRPPLPALLAHSFGFLPRGCRSLTHRRSGSPWVSCHAAVANFFHQLEPPVAFSNWTALKGGETSRGRGGQDVFAS